MSVAAIAVACAALALPARAVDIADLWNFADPASSERVFRAELAAADGDLRLELLTQIARTYSLRGKFDEAHRLLDELEPQIGQAGPAPRVRLRLERGRTFRSSGRPGRARPLFVEAWTLARESGLDELAVDAAHMVALVEPKTDDQILWNRRALSLAEKSAQPHAQRWKGSLYNNIGWTLHDAGRYEEALQNFEAAQRERERLQRVAEIRIAKWAVARCLRSLKRHDEALKLQRALEAEFAAANESDGYVFEELAELLEVMGRSDEARPYFRRAAETLGEDGEFSKNERARLERLRAKGAGS